MRRGVALVQNDRQRYKAEKKKGHSEILHSLTAFFASFFCCTAIFSLGALIVLSCSLGWFGIFSKTQAKQTAAKAQLSLIKADSFAMLFCVHDDKTGYPTQMLLYRLDAARGCTHILPLPVSLALPGEKADATLCTVYQSAGIEESKAALEKLFTIKINKTCDIGSGNFQKLFTLLGGLYGAVPQTITFNFSDGSGKITLPASPTQYLDSKKLYALISSSGYKGGAAAQLKEQAALMREFVIEKLTDGYLCDPYRYYAAAFNLVATDFSMCDLLTESDALTALSSPGKVKVVLPACKPMSRGVVITNSTEISRLFS